MPRSKTAIILLRVGLAFGFAYAAVAGFMAPANWVGWFPTFATQYIPENTLLLIFGVVEVALAALLLFTKRPFYPALVGAALLIGMVVFNLGALDIVFRDVSLALAALALAALSRK